MKNFFIVVILIYCNFSFGIIKEDYVRSLLIWFCQEGEVTNVKVKAVSGLANQGDGNADYKLERMLRHDMGMEEDKKNQLFKLLRPKVDLRAINSRHQGVTHQESSGALNIGGSGGLQTKNQEEKGAYAVEVQSKRSGISDPKYINLVIGSEIGDRTGSVFNKDITLFADVKERSDLTGDIHETIHRLKKGNRFEQIHFTGLPSTEFTDQARSVTLFKKIYSLMKDEGMLKVNFGIGLFDNKKFREQVLIPVGFQGAFDSERYIQKGVSLVAYKFIE